MLEQSPERVSRIKIGFYLKLIGVREHQYDIALGECFLLGRVYATQQAK